LSNKLLKTFFAAVGLAASACGTTDQQPVDADEVTTLAVKDGTDIEQALKAIPGTAVLSRHENDGVPSFVKGNFGKATGSAQGLAPTDAKATVQTALSAVAPIFRLRVEDLVYKKTSVDDSGNQHMRFQQMKNGLQVINGELILHVDAKGNVYAANGDARESSAVLGFAQLPAPTLAAEAAAAAAAKSTEAMDKQAKTERLVYVRDTAGNLVLAHETRVTGMQLNGIPVEDMVYINADNGKVALRAPKVYTALNRAVHSANNGTSLPGTLRRSEGGAASGDAHVDGNYTKLGGTYNCYFTNFGRDSYNAAGAQLKSTVHYSSNYVNAYWNSTQMVYGDGDGVQSGMLGLSADVTTHELTHAVTENESNLTYSGESGGINEAMSDIFGAYCQSWESGTWATTDSVFMVGDDIWTPATPNDALRYMYDPAKDGSSKDYWVSGVGSVDVHYSSGIANLAFTLMSRGGTHPRGKSTIQVTGVGTQKAGKVWYFANRDYLTSSSNYAALKTALANAAAAAWPGDAAVADAADKAMQAVGVGGAPPPPPPTTVLTNGVALTGQTGSTGANAYYKLTVPAGQTSLVFEQSGGTGDADLYVRRGAAPDSATYDCRPYTSGNAETCTFTNPVAGDWYVMINAYSSYSGLSIKGTYGGGGGGGNVLTNGVVTAPYSGASGSMTCWTLDVPAGKTQVVFNQAGGTGDADLYVRFGAAPTTTTYNCRPYLSGNTETCTISAPSAGTWYACSRGYTAYTSTTMKGTYP
jgi:Zn-dependent metalloprotease